MSTRLENKYIYIYILFFHSYIQIDGMQPYKVTANSSEVVRVRCLAKRHLDTLFSGVLRPLGGLRWPPEGLVCWFAACWPPVVDGCYHKWGRSSLKENQAKKMQAYYDYLKQMIIIEQLGRWFSNSEKAHFLL
jgi:hypothetical protein